jgi:hypothetical protein
MQLRTRRGSKAYVYKKNGNQLVGAYDDGEGRLIPCSWDLEGRYDFPKQCSLDIVYDEEESTRVT